MSWDIYGEPLRRGHCEVHPYVHEEYPCSACIADKQSSEHRDCRGVEHDLYLAREHIDHLKQERDALAAHAENLRLVVSYYLKTLRDLLEDSDSGPIIRHYFDGGDIDKLEAALAEHNTTSLARLKAQWKVEVLLDLHEHW